MRPPAPQTPWLLYIGSLAIGLTVIATSLGLIAQASTGSMQQAQREKSSVDLQIESAREIRAALARPIVTPPLPPITARRLHDVRTAQADRPKKPRMSVAGMDAMAMQTQSFDGVSAYAAPDLHRPQ